MKIVHTEFHSYEPYLPMKLGNNDEIIIPIHEIDKYTLPCDSYLDIEGKLTKSDGTISTAAHLINNGIAFLFRELRYQSNGVTINFVRDVGLTSTLKAYLSYNRNECTRLKNAGWNPLESNNKSENKSLVNIKHGSFNVCIPLKFLMGFFGDYEKINLNCKQELILIRDNSDTNAIITTDKNETVKIILDKLTWNMPHVCVGIPQELSLTKLIDRNTDIVMAFRSWELVEYPELLKTNRHNWSVKTFTKVETPRHIILAFQISKRDEKTEDVSQFNDIGLRNVKVFLNAERYPYNDLNLDMENDKFAILYDMYSQFQSAYYGTKPEPVFDPANFTTTKPNQTRSHCLY
ncbi:uncharacterized protein LOC115889753 [Sitophilus oryzae]|uniref:Uncharacterized protein LOC115889753 n=1 Tax=Sitophilus oryzae TaxID=7048 RepID=A0A6J2YSB5_SITOR|nr:uncharacterized protein LOC115889753 [Sitophilus oryzae]